MFNHTTFQHTLDNLDDIQSAFDALALIASQSDVEIHSVAPVMRQINKNLAAELELLRITMRMIKV
jgi:hypothetical protein